MGLPAQDMMNASLERSGTHIPIVVNANKIHFGIVDNAKNYHNAKEARS